MMMRFLLVVAAFGLFPFPVSAQEETETAQSAAPLRERADSILAAMRGQATYSDVFAESFRNAVPEDQFHGIVTQLESQFGAIIGIEAMEPTSPYMANLAFRLERGIASGNFQLQGQDPYRVTGLLLTNVEPVDDSAESLVADLSALPGETSLLVTRLASPNPLIAHNADVQMALGSTFKLYVLSALARSIGAGAHSWDDVVPLSERSFPSGQMQDWPQGAPVTLQTLATLMISISDNTATDQLIAILGREAVEAEVRASGHAIPEATIPFMTTREMFVLKSGDGLEVEAYRAMSAEERLAVLEALGDVEREPARMLAAFTGDPNAIDIEWFASGEDIVRLFDRLIDTGDQTVLDVLGVNAGMSDAAAGSWRYVGYKGGSEPGVLNMSWLLQDDAGDWFVVTIGWNNPQAVVDLQQLNFLAMRAIALAAAN